MITETKSYVATPKLALNRIEAAEALGLSPATIDRLTLRGLLRPSRATRRPMYSVVELQRFLKETTQADYQPPEYRRLDRCGPKKARRQTPVGHSADIFPDASPPESGEQTTSAENQNKKGK